MKQNRGLRSKASKVLGHGPVDQTVKYLRLNLDDQQEAMDLFAQMQDDIMCPENGIFGAKPEVVRAPKAF